MLRRGDSSASDSSSKGRSPRPLSYPNNAQSFQYSNYKFQDGNLKLRANPNRNRSSKRNSLTDSDTTSEASFSAINSRFVLLQIVI